ncbi:amino acid adenylation domain-containing protein, partial [Streptomyces sp. NPDC088674]|uniref:non-ribosomal peptide synthetase n=1 Tax=Streptomyces sp. NPDC088674 TaxID=3365869 RepID=UPI00382E00C3
MDRLEGASAMYNVPVVTRMRGPLDTERLAAALTDVVGRHEALRTVYAEHDGEPAQVVVPAGEARVDVGLTECGPERADAVVAEHSGHVFDLSRDLPVHAHVVRLAPDDHLLVLVLHHIAADGWSIQPFGKDLAHAYAARLGATAPQWPDLPVNYADYALWQADLLGDPDDPASLLSTELAHWSAVLAELPQELPLPADRARPRRASHRGASVQLRAGTGPARRVAELARRSGATPFMVTHAALVATLFRSGAGTDIVVGTPVAGRTEETLDDMVGFFVNSLVLRTDTSGAPTFAELLDRVRETDLTAYAHQELPFDRLVEHLRPSRSLASHPLFQVSFTHTTGPEQPLTLPGLRCAPAPTLLEAAKFDLDVTVVDEGPAGLAVRIGYATELFDEATVVDLGERFLRLLDAVTAEPRTRISEVDVLSPAQRQLVRHTWPGTPAEPPAGTVLDALDARADATPDERALVFGDITLTRAELRDRVNGYAHALTARGVAAGEVVAVALPRSAEYVVAVLGVLRAGSVCVNVTRQDPRAGHLLTDSGAVLVIGESDAYEGLPVLTPGEVCASSRPVAPPAPASAAYVVYTSGSTGRPKGVVVSHRSLANLLRAHREDLLTRLPAGRSRIALTAAFTFDASWDPVLWMLAGHELHVIDDDTRRDAHALAEHVVRERIDVVNSTPSFVSLLLATGLFRREHHPSFLVLGGEPASEDLWRALAELPGVDAVNIYGPTEATVDATLAAVRGDEPVIGRPLHGVVARVLDATLSPVPPGVPGELYLSGGSLAMHYLGRPGPTSASFVADPHGEPGTRMYRTGDVVRWNRDGRLAFVARADEQVKLRGFRIEPGEVEAALRALPGVGSAVVVPREYGPGDTRLVGYYTGTAEQDGLRGALTRRLPDYMVPAALVRLETLPLTARGKLDRAALPAPTGERRRSTSRTPRTDVLCRLFAEVLGLPEVGPGDGFFDLGGHSLLAVRLTLRLRAVLGVDVALHTLFEHATPAALDRVLDSEARTGRPPLRPYAPRPDVLPVSSGQRQLWLTDLVTGAGAAYNLSTVVRVVGGVDVGVLAGALGDVVGRHEVLRTVLVEGGGGVVQVVLPPVGEVRVGVCEVGADRVDAVVASLCGRRFDLSGELPLRA